MFYATNAICSHDSDSIGDIEGVLIRGESDVCLLVTSWGDQSVNLLNLDVVKLLARLLNHSLVSSLVDNEDKGVVVFNGLDG